MTQATWYCVIRCENYALVYIGRDRAKALAAASADTFFAEGPTMGQAERNAAIGAGMKTQSRRTERRPAIGEWWIRTGTEP